MNDANPHIGHHVSAEDAWDEGFEAGVESVKVPFDLGRAERVVEGVKALLRGPMSAHDQFVLDGDADDLMREVNAARVARKERV